MIMLEKKAREIFALYQQAELSGDNTKAQALEAQLNDGGWNVTSTSSGITIVKERNGLFSNTNWGDSSDIDFYIPKNTDTAPYNGTSNTGSRVWLYIGIGAGVIILTIVTIIIVKRIKKARNGGVKQV
jgi:hypothetical protein